jgi:outer membrane protein assembly factor BamB
LGPQRNGVVSVRHFAIPDQPTNVELLWNIGVGAGWASFAVVQDRAITLEQRDDQECLTCYRLSDGALLWKVQHDSFHDETFGGAGPRSTPTIFEGHVYAQGQDGTVWCVDWLTGNMVWKVELLELAEWTKDSSEQAITWARAGSPLIVDGLCVLPFGGPDQQSSEGRSLIALSITDGSIQWRSGKDQISYASPMLATLAGQRQIVSVNEKTITGHQVETGQVIWSFPWMGQSNGGANCASIMVAGADQFLIGKGYGGGSALVQITNQDNGKQMADAIWTSSRILKTKFTHACVDGPIAYAINNGSLEAVNIAEGISNWQQPRRDRLGQGQLLLVDDTLIGQSESGEIVLSAANPDEYVELIRIPAMRSKTWNIPTIAGRHLIVRNDRQAFCFLLPKRDDTLAP